MKWLANTLTRLYHRLASPDHSTYTRFNQLPRILNLKCGDSHLKSKHFITCSFFVSHFVCHFFDWMIGILNEMLWRIEPPARHPPSALPVSEHQLCILKVLWPVECSDLNGLLNPKLGPIWFIVRINKNRHRHSKWNSQVLLELSLASGCTVART